MTDGTKYSREDGWLDTTEDGMLVQMHSTCGKGAEENLANSVMNIDGITHSRRFECQDVRNEICERTELSNYIPLKEIGKGICSMS